MPKNACAFYSMRHQVLRFQNGSCHGGWTRVYDKRSQEVAGLEDGAMFLTTSHDL
jgi:hypothetical protein